MEQLERYLFDVNGFLIVEDVFSTDEIAELNRHLDEYDLWNVDDTDPRWQQKWQYGDNYKIVGPAHMWDDAFRRAVVHPKIHAYVSELLGPEYRYDHGHALLMQPGAGKLQLHGGATPYSPFEYYHYRDDRFFNGLLAISVALTDAPAESGGFVCVPGSHKACVRAPESVINLETTGPWLRRSSLKAGSIAIFTEALTHGTYPWSGDYERRTLLMKYAPGHMAYEDNYPVPSHVPDAVWDDRMRSVFRPPFTVIHDTATHADRMREPVAVG